MLHLIIYSVRTDNRWFLIPQKFIIRELDLMKNKNQGIAIKVLLRKFSYELVLKC